MGCKKTLLYLKFLCILLPQLLILQSALSQSIVEFLPGFGGPLPFALETGYVGVDESEDVQLFYYFFPSENNPKEDPLMLWLTGGPGCSTISGILYEIGPIKFQEAMYNGSLPRLKLNRYSWTKVASIIFLDLPVGTGFSYARTAKASHSGDQKASHNANEFLRKWLIDHPEFQSNPVYLGGDSYTGITLPVYFQEMSQGNEEGMKPFINLKELNVYWTLADTHVLQGYLLGNPATNFTFETNFAIPFAHGKGFISDELYESLRQSCEGNYNPQTQDPTNLQCQLDILSYYKCIQGINVAHVSEDLCEFFVSPKPLSHGSPESLRRSLYSDDSQCSLGQLRSSSSTPLRAFNCRTDGYLLSGYWFNDESVQEAIHVRKGSIKTWVRCNYELNYTYDISSSVMYHKNLSTKVALFWSINLKIFLFFMGNSGDHDMIVTFIGTQAWIRSLNYSIVDDWRSWIVEGQVGGYTRTYSNKMAFATVKGGGHTAPEYRPKECYTMFNRWISGKPL